MYVLIFIIDVHVTKYGRAPIHWAASRGNTEIIEMLIQAKCEIEARDKVRHIFFSMLLLESYFLNCRLDRREMRTKRKAERLASSDFTLKANFWRPLCSGSLNVFTCEVDTSLATDKWILHLHMLEAKFSWNVI
jgi:hypothetical protein